MSVLGARGFYFAMYIGFYVSVCMYPNTLSWYLKEKEYFWFCLYLVVHGLSMYFFLFARSNPGWVEPDMPSDFLENQNLNNTDGSNEGNLFGSKSKDSGANEGEGESGIELNDIEMRGGRDDSVLLKNDKISHLRVENRSSTLSSQPSFENIREVEFKDNRGCDICGIKRLPFRARHCKDCGKCVRKFDHHCFWIGGCVGELNHRKFYGFIAL